MLSGQKKGEQWDWQTTTPPSALPDSQPCADADGHIWYLREEREIGVWDGKETRMIPPSSALRGRQIKVLTADGLGRIWAGTDRSLLLWQTNRFEEMTPTNGPPILHVKRIIPSGTSNVWVEAGGKMRRCAGRQWLAESADWKQELGKVTDLRFIHGDAEGGLWAAAGDLGLIHILPDGTFHRLTTREGLPSNTIRFAYQDRDGNTWTGYERGGLVRVRRRLFRVVGTEQGLADSLVNTVCQDSQGGVWVGMHNGEVGHYENGHCTNIALPTADNAQDSCVASDGQGRVWIGAQGVGLVQYEPSGEFRTIATMSQLQSYPRLLLPGKNGRMPGRHDVFHLFDFQWKFHH